MSLLQTERALHAPFNILSRCPKTSDQSCKMLVPDTLFYQHGSLRIWYAPDADTGEVIKRDKRECTKEHILEVFCQESHQTNKSGNNIKNQGGAKGGGGGGGGPSKPLPGMPVAVYRHYNASLLSEDNQHAADCIFSGDAEPLSVDYFDADLLLNFLSTRENKHNVLVQRFVLNSSQHASTVQVIWSPHRTIPMVRQNINNIMDVQVPMRDRCATDESCAFSREVKSTPKMKIRMEEVCKTIVDHWETIEQRQITRMVLFFCFNRDKEKDPVFMWAPEIQITIHQLTPAEASHKAQFNTRRALLQLSPPILRSDVQYGGSSISTSTLNSRNGPVTAQTRQARMRGKLSTKLASLLSGGNSNDVEQVLETLDRTFATSRKCAPIVAMSSVSTHSSVRASGGGADAARETPWERREHHRRKLEARSMKESGGDTSSMIYGAYSKRPQSALSGPKIDGRKSPSYLRVLNSPGAGQRQQRSTSAFSQLSNVSSIKPKESHNSQPGGGHKQHRVSVQHAASGMSIGSRRALLSASVRKGSHISRQLSPPSTRGNSPISDSGESSGGGCRASRSGLSSPAEQQQGDRVDFPNDNDDADARVVQAPSGAVATAAASAVSHLMGYLPYLHKDIGDCLIKLGSLQALVEASSDLTHTLSTHRPGSGGEAFSLLSHPLSSSCETELRRAICPTDPANAFMIQENEQDGEERRRRGERSAGEATHSSQSSIPADTLLAVTVKTSSEARAVSRRLKALEKAIQLLELQLRMKLLSDLYVQIRSEALERIPTTGWTNLRDPTSNFGRANKRYLDFQGGGEENNNNNNVKGLNSNHIQHRLSHHGEPESIGKLKQEEAEGGHQGRRHQHSLGKEFVVCWNHSFWVSGGTGEEKEESGPKEEDTLATLPLSDMVEELLLCIEQDFERDFKMYLVQGGAIVKGAPPVRAVPEKSILAPVPNPHHNLRAAPTADPPLCLERPSVKEENLAILLAFHHTALRHSGGPLLTIGEGSSGGDDASMMTIADLTSAGNNGSPLTPHIETLLAGTLQQQKIPSKTVSSIRFPTGLSKYPSCLTQ